MQPSLEFQQLIDSPNESLDVEYKAWLDLTGDNEARANTARHLAALANHGGGRLVFGFNDDMSLAGPTPFPSIIHSRDLYAGIVRKYLEPAFQCDVYNIRSALGNSHPVVIVPPHGGAPICAKANGPEIGGKVRGISQGTYYVRKPGPESAPVITAAEWAPIIRRCAIHERASLLGAISALLQQPSQSVTTSQTDRLRAWHEAAHTAYLRDARKFDAPPELEKNHYQVSYSIDRTGGAELTPDQLRTVLGEASREVQSLLQSGWSLFYQFTSSDIAPRFTDDPSVGGEKEFLQLSLLHATAAPAGLRVFDLWRVSLDGMATQIREYWEDHEQGSPHFTPDFLVQTLAELVRHAQAVAERFDTATTVTFRCEWWGLAGRLVVRVGPPTQARDDHALSVGSWPVAALGTELPEIVAKLAGPVMRRFVSTSPVTPQWVSGILAKLFSRR